MQSLNFSIFRLFYFAVNHQQNNFNSYQPGKCNIGQREISVRKKFLLLFLPMSIILSAGSYFIPESKILWIGVLVCSFSSIVLLSEIKYKFCVIFGFFSLYNFKQLGNLDHIQESDKKEKDRQRVLKTIVASMFLALIYSAMLHYAILLVRN